MTSTRIAPGAVSLISSSHLPPMAQIIAGAAVEPHAVAVLTGNDAKTIVLDLVQPLAGRTKQ
jgi:hypothetical protein